MLDCLEFLATTLVKKKRETLAWPVPECIAKKWGSRITPWTGYPREGPETRIWGKWLIWEKIPGNTGRMWKWGSKGKEASLDGLISEFDILWPHDAKNWLKWKRPWCWERLKAGGEGDDRGWDGWMAWLTRWTWVWASSGSWWWTGRPGVLQSMGSQRVRHDWATELNWTWAPGSGVLVGSSVETPPPKRFTM